MLEALVMVNLGVLRNKRLGVPPLYESGVRYEREKTRGVECWLDAYTCWHQGWGDCDDLACWRAAELILQGVSAVPVIQVQRWKPAMFHIVVGDSNGRIIDDPSNRLGMTGKA